jgi:hypothetical protein
LRAKVSVPSRALCVLRPDELGSTPEMEDAYGFQCPLELCVFCDSANVEGATSWALMVSVPSRALCVLRHVGNVSMGHAGMCCFSALSSFVCSATFQRWTRMIRAVCVSVPSRALCVLRLGRVFSVRAVPDNLSGFQCPLELCVFCDLILLVGFIAACQTNPSFSALSSFVCSATANVYATMVTWSWFQCPLELCVFCDHVERLTGVRMATLQVSVPSRALCVLRPRSLRASFNIALTEFQCPLELCVFWYVSMILRQL